MYFYCSSNGKLMLTGEYVVLRGASALALPSVFGQSLMASPAYNNGNLLWTTFIGNEKWFQALFSTSDWYILDTNKADIAERLQRILQAASALSPDFTQKANNHNVECHINFDISWGLGSSSSLLANIAQWADIEWWKLHKATSNGSGYDVACALSPEAIQYQIVNNSPVVKKFALSFNISQHLYFVYQGKKQDSQKSVSLFNNNSKVDEAQINRIDNINQIIKQTSNIREFAYQIQQHEQIISDILQQKTIQQKFFSDFDGVVKSLGAWGGDFVMAVSTQPRENVELYFASKGLKTFFAYSEIIRY